jgi:hypothetical protein
VICVECHRPFRWEEPGERGMMQDWYRNYESSPHGFRCADRAACARATGELQPSLFDNQEES